MAAEYDDMLASIFGDCENEVAAAQEQHEEKIVSSSSKVEEATSSPSLCVPSSAMSSACSSITPNVSPKNTIRDSCKGDNFVIKRGRRSLLRLDEKCFLIKLVQDARMGFADSNDWHPDMTLWGSVANSLKKKFPHLHLNADQCLHAFYNSRSILIEKLKSGKPLKQPYLEYMKLFKEDPKIQDILNGASDERSSNNPVRSLTSQESKEFLSRNSLSPNATGGLKETMNAEEFVAGSKSILHTRSGMSFEKKCYLINLIQKAKAEGAEEASDSRSVAISWDLVTSALNKKFPHMEMNADRCRGCYYDCKYNLLKVIKAGKPLTPRQMKYSQLFKDDPQFQEVTGSKGAVKHEKEPRVTQSVSRDSKRSSDEPSPQPTEQETTRNSLFKKIKIEHRLAAVIYVEVEVGADDSDSELEEPLQLRPGMSLTEGERLALEEVSVRVGLSVQQVLDQMMHLDVSSSAA